MKTSFLKIVLPAFAIVMAVGLAFATEDSNSSYVGYIATPFGVQQIQTDCPDTGELLCFEGANQVYNDPGLTDPRRDWQ
ncbi:hypothetical protein K1F50_18075 [Muricauda oceani]|jgi:Family of unknown function (DUF6520)|uniref:Secreted protein n=1 Tax=Flagellimonas oceani TaxID=2698672 RepID=A0A6G7IZI4_9FLAO|nr:MULTISPECIES: DUF6520 family protein [Allomuricauda]MBW8244722.1 hypothetical protein [Allomuricauda oceani]QII43657.1 hypothetical protein GVT53_02835 [Allomuricauda oceani]